MMEINLKGNHFEVCKRLEPTGIRIQSPEEVFGCLGRKLTEIWVNTGEDAFCNEIEEIYLEFQGKEWRIYIDPETKKLTIYSD